MIITEKDLTSSLDPIKTTIRAEQVNVTHHQIFSQSYPWPAHGLNALWHRSRLLVQNLHPPIKTISSFYPHVQVDDHDALTSRLRAWIIEWRRNKGSVRHKGRTIFREERHSISLQSLKIDINRSHAACAESKNLTLTFRCFHRWMTLTDNQFGC